MVIKNTMEQYDSKHNKTWRIRERADESMQGKMQKTTGKKKREERSIQYKYVHNTTGYYRIGIRGCGAAGKGDNLAFVSSLCEDARTRTIALFC